MQMSKEQMNALPIGLAMRVTTRPVLTTAKPLHYWRSVATHNVGMTQSEFNAAEHYFRRSQRSERVQHRNTGHAGMYRTVGGIPVYTRGR